MGVISYKIEKLLEVKNMTKTAFAKRVGIHIDTVYNLNDESIKVSTLLKISEILNVPITYFFENTEKSESKKLPKSKKTNVFFELESTDILKIDMKNKRLEILKK